MVIFEVNIEETMQRLLLQEDTDKDTKITIEDSGPKAFELTTTEGQKHTITGTYHLANLLQELVLAKEKGQDLAKISLERIEEAPVFRVSRMIRDYYWQGLTRTMDKEGIEELLKDTKNETLEGETRLRVYIPHDDTLALDYYTEISQVIPLDVIRLPIRITPEYVRDINDKPGILSLKLEKTSNGMKGIPFVVPGGRFNEMYGWDSYFESIGLILDGKVELAKAMADNFQYEIEHYGKILNANRSYYLTRTQPPFYSSLIREVFEVTHDISWLRSHVETAIKEYETVWMVHGKRLTENGLNRYLAEGLGRPPEAEAGHFHHEFGPHAKKVGMDVHTFESSYAQGKIENAALDRYFIHDRSVRESGHDTSYRLEGICADLNVVELNAFLYKYETDFAKLILRYFENRLEIGATVYTSEYWLDKAVKRREAVDTYLWNETKGGYFDYNHLLKEQTDFISATALTPLWAGMSTPEQAQLLVANILPLLKEKGGIASCTKESRGIISAERPQKQWDYPNGWAPHQMMIWKGLLRYGFEKELQELVYRWLYMITKNAVDYNGTIPEKYDVVSATHKVFAEYGNVGTEFQYITKEGFGWMNASYQYGISLLKPEYIEKLNDLIDPEKLF